MMTIDDKHPLSRRELIAGAGKLTAMGILGASVGGMGLLTGCGGNASTNTTVDSSVLPWPYEVLDASDILSIEETAHEDWFSGFCAYATMGSILKKLREKIGEPYNSFPLDVIVFGHGGTAGWGATCGTLTGAGMAASLAAGPTRGEEVLNDVMNWYTSTELPIYQPQNPRVQIRTVSMSSSPLCHISVGKWMKKEGVGFLSPQQMERCARLSADVAAKTVEYINRLYEGTFTPANKTQVNNNGMPSQNNCAECHDVNIPPVPVPGGGESLIKRG